MRRGLITLGLTFVVSLVLPLPALASPTIGKIFTKPLTVDPSPNPSNPPDQVFKEKCPKGFVPIAGTMFLRDAGLEIKASEPKPAANAWAFTVLNFSSNSLTAQVQVRCIPDFPTIGRGRLVESFPLSFKVFPGDLQYFRVRCPVRDIATGFGFENPKVGRVEGIPAWVSQRLKAHTATETIRNVGSEPLHFASVGVCLHERVKVGPDPADLLLKKLSTKATLKPPTVTAASLGTSCPRKSSLIVSTGTEFGPLDPGLSAFPGPEGTLFEQPAEIFDSNPSGQETVKGQSDCLSYHRVL